MSKSHSSSSRHIRRTSLIALWLLASSASAQRLLNPAPAVEHFGRALVATPALLLVGATGEDSTSSADIGVVHVYELQGNNYVQSSTLQASDGAGNDQFGNAIAVSGNLAVIGAWRDDLAQGSFAGSAYVFERSGNSFSQIAKLQSPEAATGDQFGTAVAISGETIIIGAPQDDVDGVGVNVGTAHVFQRNGGNWTRVVRLLASDPAINARFGGAIAASGNLVIVAAPDADQESGTAYVYRLDGIATSLEQKLISSDRAPFDKFGSAVALEGSIAVVGARQHAGAIGTHAGAVYVYSRTGQLWTQQARIQPADLQPGDLFGAALALQDFKLLIGAPHTRMGSCCDQGMAHLFSGSSDGTQWRRLHKLGASDGAPFDRLGSSVALAGERALAGAPDSNDPVSTPLESGSVLRFTQTVPLFADGFEGVGGR